MKTNCAGAILFPSLEKIKNRRVRMDAVNNEKKKRLGRVEPRGSTCGGAGEGYDERRRRK